MPRRTFATIPATPEVRAAVCTIVARYMSAELARYPVDELSDDALCANRLYRAGYSSAAIFHAAGEARELARQRASTLAKAAALALFGLFIAAPALPDFVAPTAVHAIEFAIAVEHCVEEAIEEPLEDLGLLTDDDGK